VFEGSRLKVNMENSKFIVLGRKLVSPLVEVEADGQNMEVVRSFKYLSVLLYQ